MKQQRGQFQDPNKKHAQRKNLTSVSKSICSSENCCSKCNKFSLVNSSFIVWQLSSILVSIELVDNDVGADEFLKISRQVEKMLLELKYQI